MFRRFITIALSGLTLVACRESNTEERDREIKLEAADSEPRPLYVNGDTLHYLDVGEGEPVILVHGAFSDYSIWDAQVKALSEQYRVIAYSRRSAWPNAMQLSDSLDSSPEVHARDLAALIRELELGPAHLVGHSWGANTILALAFEEPGLVKTLTLGEPALLTVLEGVPGRDSIMSVLAEDVAEVNTLFESGRTEDAIRKGIAAVMESESYYDTVPRKIREMWPRSLEDIVYVARGNFHNIQKAGLRSLNMPVLLIEGEHSPGFLALGMRVADTVIPQSKHVLLRDATHGLETDQPEAFNEILLNFLSENS